MSNRARFSKPDYIVAGSLAADLTGTWLNVAGIDNISLQCVWTGTPTGVLIVHGSNDGPGPADVDTRIIGPSGRVGASVIHTVASGNPAGAAGDLIIPLTDRAETWIRLFYDRTAGTGALSVGVSGKGI